MNWRERIEIDPVILCDKPCINGTRIPAALVLGYLAAGRDTAAILREFPGLATEDAAACLDFARDLADFEASAARVSVSFVSSLSRRKSVRPSVRPAIA